MAPDADFSIDSTPSLQQLATFLADELFNVNRIARLEQAMTNAHQKGATVANAAEIQAAPALSSKKESLSQEGYDKARKALGWALAHLVAHLLGVEAPADLFENGNLRPQDSAIGLAISKTVIGGIAGDVGELVPGDETATRFMGMLAHLTIQSWAEGILIEELSSLHGLLHPIEEISKLGKELINGMGLNRLARVALRPLAQVLVATPLDWKYKKQFRPNLLSEGDIIKAFLRGDYTGDEAAEELARLGYSDRRQDMLIKSAEKRLSLDDVLRLVRSGTLGREYAIQNLRDEGFDQETAEFAVVAAETQRFESINDNSLPTIVRAFVNREIDESTFRTFLPAVIPDPLEQDSHVTAAQTERELNIRHLSHAEVLDCVEHDILTVAFYRAWLQREGYPEDEATALEVRLRLRLNAEATAADERARVAQEKADAKAAAEQAKQDRLAQIEADRALKREGSVADLTRAVVRGLIPIARLEQVLVEQYSKDTVTILVALALADKVAYDKQQQAAADARQRAGQKSIDVGTLEAGVLENVLTIEQFRQALAQRGFDAGDIDVLAAVVAARKKDLDAARAQRARAEAAATKKQIDLGRAEQLVVRGHWTFANYETLLRSLGFDEAARAAMADLLQLKVDDAAAAAATRADVAAKAKAKGLALEQLRRAVVLGVRTVDAYQAYLVQNGFTADAQAVLLAEVRADVAEAAAARQRRHAADAGAGARQLPLDRVARAARLGIVTLPAYQDRLIAAGYSPDDVSIELDLLTVEIADAAATRAKRDALAQSSPDKGLSLNELAKAVTIGAATIDDYRARAAALGFAAADVALLVAVLQDTLDSIADATARHTAIDGELTARSLSLGELEAAVLAGLRTIDDYQAQLLQWGYGQSDAQLLVSLLTAKIAAKPAPPTGGTP